VRHCARAVRRTTERAWRVRTKQKEPQTITDRQSPTFQAGAEPVWLHSARFGMARHQELTKPLAAGS
jgi:hypothetical protein